MVRVALADLVPRACVGAQIEKDKVLAGDSERRARELQLRLDALAKVERDLQKSIKSMEDVDGEVRHPSRTTSAEGLEPRPG